MTATKILIVIALTVVGWVLLNIGVMALMIWASRPDPHLGEAADAASREVARRDQRAAELKRAISANVISIGQPRRSAESYNRDP